MISERIRFRGRLNLTHGESEYEVQHGRRFAVEECYVKLDVELAGSRLYISWTEESECGRIREQETYLRTQKHHRRLNDPLPHAASSRPECPPKSGVKPVGMKVVKVAIQKYQLTKDSNVRSESCHGDVS